MFVFPIKTQPLYVFLDAVHILRFFRNRVGIVEPKVGISAIFFCEAKVQANACGVAHMEVAIWLGRKTGYNAWVLSILQIVLDDLFKEVKGAFFFLYLF